MNIASIFVLSVFVEGVIDYFIKDKNAAEPQTWLKYVSAALGIAVALVYRVDLLEMLGIPAAVPFAGSILTGFIIGRGSNYLNDFLTKVKGGSTPAPSVISEG